MKFRGNSQKINKKVMCGVVEELHFTFLMILRSNLVEHAELLLHPPQIN
jgi:hypothetical protein